MTLMFEQAGHDLLQTPLPVTELHATSGRHPVDLLVGEVSQNAEGTPRNRQLVEQVLKLDMICPVVTTVPAQDPAINKRCDPVIAVGCVQRARGDGAVAEFLAAWASETQ